MAQRRYVVELLQGKGEVLYGFPTDAYRVNGEVLKYAKASTSRRCFTGKDVILKVEKYPDQNQTEVKFWLQASKNDRRKLATLLAWADDYSWVLQRRYEFGGPNHDRKWDALNKWARKVGIFDLSLTYSGQPRNWGVRKTDKKAVVFDYGCVQF